MAKNKKGLMGAMGGGRRIRATFPGNEVVRQSRLQRMTRINDRPVNLITNGGGAGAGKARIELATGEFTYRAIPFMLVSDEEIVGKTVQRAGQHIVNRDNLSEYITHVSLEMNGAVMQELSMGELVRRNGFQTLDFADGMTGFKFPGPGQYQSQAHRDLFALGTMGQRGLKVKLTLAAAFDDATMQIKCAPHYVEQGKSPGFVITTERVLHTFTGAGKHTFVDLPDGEDLKDVWIIGAGITHLKCTIDGEVLYDLNRQQFNNYLIGEGRDPGEVGDNWFIDFHADGLPLSLAALDLPAEVRRGAQIKLELTTSNASTEVEFLCSHVGPYRKVR